MKPICRYAVMLVFLFISVTNSQTFTNIRVNNLTTGNQSTDGGNNIAVFNSYIYTIWYDMGSTYSSYVSVSTDGGATFSNGVPVVSGGVQIFPAMSIDNIGNLYVAWDEVAGQDPQGVFFAKSTNNGSTFSSKLTVSSTGIFPQIAVYGTHAYIMYLDPLGSNQFAFKLAASSNSGSSFGTPVVLNNATITDLKFEDINNITADNTGNVYCVWNDKRRQSSGGTGSDIYFSKSTDNGATFTTNIIVNSTNNTLNIVKFGPAVAASGSNVYVVWREEDNTGNNRQLLFAKSTDGGASFSTPVVLASTNKSPAIFVNSSGHIYIAYPGYTAGPPVLEGIFCIKSTDQGSTFSQPAFLNSTNANANYASLYIDNAGMVNSVWQDGRNGNDDIFFTRGAVPVGNEKFENNLPSDFQLLQNYPNPFNPVTTIEFNLPTPGRYGLVVYNSIGQEVARVAERDYSAGPHKIRFDAGTLASGIYYYSLTGTDKLLIKKMVLLK